MSGGGFGALDSMNKTISNNRSLLKKDRGFSKLKDNVSWKSKKTRYRFKKASEKQLTAIRSKMKTLARVNLIKGIIAVALSATLIYFALPYVIDFLLEVY